MGTHVRCKIVKIQDLEPVKEQNNQRHSTTEDVKSYWMRQKCEHWGKRCDCKVLTYIENNPVKSLSYGNGFYDAFAQAYNNHQDVILSPDDIWLMVCFHFSKYINTNAEKMRHLFVAHEGKIKLTVVTENQTDESQWDEFFELIIKAIGRNTKDNITDVLQCDFSTTTPTESVISVVSIMDSFKQYFTYGRCIPECGIRQARFMGTEADWKKLIGKVADLKKYAITNEWLKYIEELLPILDQFLQTFQGHVDVDFWNRIMNFRDGSIGSGSTIFVSGWILRFFGLDGEVDAEDIKSYDFDVPVEIENHITLQRKNVNMVGGFGGIYAEEDFDGVVGYRPQLSLIVFHDGNVAPL